MSADERIQHTPRTAEDAAHLIRNAPANSRFYIHVRTDAPIFDDPHNYYPGAFFASVHVSRDAAERFIVDAFRASLAAKGCYMPLAEHVGKRRERWKAGTMEREEYGRPPRFYYIG